MPIPPTPVAPGDATYDDLYARWERAGSPGMMESLLDGWLYRAYRPNADDRRPVFVLECSTPNLARVLATTQISWRGRKALPIEGV